MSTVEIPKAQYISILKDLIKEKASRLKDVDASDLEPWQVNLPIDDLSSINLPAWGRFEASNDAIGHIPYSD
jgi:hypothetical protein